MTLRRALVVIVVLALVWAVVVALSDGFVWHIGSFRISSRDPWRPLMVAVAVAVGTSAPSGDQDAAVTELPGCVAIKPLRRW